MNTFPIPQDSFRRGYSEEEISCIYELGKLFIETGELRKAEEIFSGLIEVSQKFIPAHLALCYLFMLQKKYEEVVSLSKYILEMREGSIEAMLFLVVAALNTRDYQLAGTHLGEVQESINENKVHNIKLLKLFKSQLVRFQESTSLTQHDD
jgi:lipopolysaccharide biosynthesis regulator YciM